VTDEKNVVKLRPMVAPFVYKNWDEKSKKNYRCFSAVTYLILSSPLSNKPKKAKLFFVIHPYCIINFFLFKKNAK